MATCPERLAVNERHLVMLAVGRELFYFAESAAFCGNLNFRFPEMWPFRSTVIQPWTATTKAF